MMNNAQNDYLAAVTHCLSDDATINELISDLVDLDIVKQLSKAQSRKLLMQILSKHLAVDTLDRHKGAQLLDIAVKHQHYNLVRWLLRHHVDPNFASNSPSILHHAIENGDIRTVITLKRYNATLNAYDIQQTGYSRFYAGFEH